jgi:prepilin-type processing-associated H-X9-DG protein
VELLVVIAIIAVLIGLLAPAVQKIREAASRMSCSNNLKQIGLALHNYHDARRAFPPSSTSGTGKRHSWIPFTLPYFEEDPLYKRYNFNKNWFAAGNAKAVAIQLRIFQCPSVPVPDRVDSTFSPNAACVDYNATKGVAPNLVQIGLAPPTDLRGVMVKNQNTRIAHITDGTSHTIMVAEDAGRPFLYNAGKLVPGGYAPGGPWADDFGPFFLNGSSADGTVVPGSCPMNCTNDKEIYSFHSQGANVLFADGSVQFIESSISIRTLAALITRSGGEVVSSY